MSELGDAYKCLMRRSAPSHKLLVPLLRWASGHEKDIELCQRINRRFFDGNSKVFIVELALYNRLDRFIQYPKKSSSKSKDDFFIDDLCKYLGWTRREFEKSESVLNVDSLKKTIAHLFGYDNKQRKLLGLPKREGIKWVKT